MNTTWTEPAVAGAVVDALLSALDSSSAALAVVQGVTLAELDYEEGEWTIGLLLSDGRTFEMRVSEVRPVPNRECPITGETNCRSRDCELHYMDAPVQFAPDICGASFTTGGLDPYGTDCDQPRGHYPSSKHSGPDPFGSDRRVRWNGGGSCAGDPLPYRDVEWS